jgi:excisionase family DNA binding protein
VEPSVTTREAGPELVGFEHLPAVLTTREAASALRIGVNELRKLVDAGDIPAARFGPRRVIRIAKSAIVGVLGARSRPSN